jgi:hypothetical protein
MDGGLKVVIINKPKYKVKVKNKNDIEIIIEEAKQKYQTKYPSAFIEIVIEPELKTVEFDGLEKEFTYQAKIKC